MALGLAACAADSDIEAAEDISASDPTLNWSNWPFYIDEDDDGNYPTLERFQEQTGISVNYMVDYDDTQSSVGDTDGRTRSELRCASRSTSRASRTER